MNLIINGESMDFEDNKSIQEILDILNIESKIVAVALNSNLIQKESYNDTFPNNGDKIELLQFIGGG